MTDVVVFPARGPRPPAPDRRVVSLVEDLLAQALTGRLRTVAVAMLREGDDGAVRPVLTWIDEPEHAMALSGAAAKLAREIADW